MIKTKKKRTERQKMTAHLDGLFREFIRKRAMLRAGGCERPECKHPRKLSYLELDTAHNESRVHMCTRWDEDNALGLCGGCHRFIDRERKEKEKLFVAKIGQAAYNRLDLLAHTRCKPDYTAIEIYLRQKLEELQEVVGV